MTDDAISSLLVVEGVGGRLLSGYELRRMVGEERVRSMMEEDGENRMVPIVPRWWR